MEIYQLRTFLTVAAEGHLTRAAERLHASQPAVSGQLRALEDECGVQLFERTPRGMVLTPAGESLAEKARQIVEAASDFIHCAESLRHAVRGRLVIGLNNRPDVLKLMPTLQLLSERHPELTYQLLWGSSGVILKGIENGEIGIGFFEGPCPSARISREALAEIELRIVAPRAWAGEFRGADWGALEERPWIFVSPECSYFRAIERLCREQGLSLKSRFEVNEDLTVLGLVARGLGLTVTSRQLVEGSPERENLVCLPHFHMTVPLNIGHLASRSGDPAIRAVREAVLEVWETSPAETLPAPVFRPPPPKTPAARSR